MGTPASADGAESGPEKEPAPTPPAPVAAPSAGNHPGLGTAAGASNADASLLETSAAAVDSAGGATPAAVAMEAGDGAAAGSIDNGSDSDSDADVAALASVIPIDQIKSGASVAASLFWSSWGAVRQTAEASIRTVKDAHLVEKVRACVSLVIS